MLCWVVSLLWQHPPAQPTMWYEIITPKIVRTGLFFPQDWHGGEDSALVQVFPLQENMQETKCLQIPPWPSDGFGTVCSCKAGGRSYKGSIFPPHHWKMLICWKGKHSWTGNWGYMSFSPTRACPFWVLGHLGRSLHSHTEGSGNGLKTPPWLPKAQSQLCRRQSLHRVDANSHLYCGKIILASVNEAQKSNPAKYLGIQFSHLPDLEVNILNEIVAKGTFTRI